MVRFSPYKDLSEQMLYYDKNITIHVRCDIVCNSIPVVVPSGTF